MSRPLTANETQLIGRVAEKLGGSEGARLMEDLKNATASEATPDGARLVFTIRGYDRPQYRGQRPYGVEGKMLDQDGTELGVLLHADVNGRLLELEYVRWGEGPLIDPDWSSLKLY